MSLPQSDALVLFGVTGDLAHKMIFPALFTMVKRDSLKVPIIGVASPQWSMAQLHDRVKDSIKRSGVIIDQRALDQLLALFKYVSGDYGNKSTFSKIKEVLGAARRPAHYLAIPPSLFATVIAGLGAASLADHARVIVEKPFGRDLASARELNRVARSIFPVMSDDVVRGQYTDYRKEPDVAKDSDVETFCARRLFIDSWRWEGVPWYLRSGKYLAETETEVLVELKPPPQRLFADSAPTTGPANYVRFRLSPSSAVALAARVKHPGKEFVGDQRELYLTEEQPGEELPYERLLGDAMAGDGAFFTREDAVEAAWGVVDSILSNHHPVHPYQRGTWGPKEADVLIAANGSWHNPGV